MTSSQDTRTPAAPTMPIEAAGSAPMRSIARFMLRNIDRWEADFAKLQAERAAAEAVEIAEAAPQAA